MAFLGKSTSEGNVGLLYSILQKCIRRGLENKALYYANIIYNEASINCFFAPGESSRIVSINEFS